MISPRKAHVRRAVSVILIGVIIVVAAVGAVGAAAFIYGHSYATVTTSTETGPYSGPAVTLNAGGSSFVNPIMQVWAYGYYNYSGFKVTTNYESIGSGAGQQGFFSGLLDFAGSDAPVNQSAMAALNGKPIVEIPETLGAVVIFYNIPAIGNVSLKFTGPLLADIWSGKITTWNNPAMTALNPGIALPNQTIVPVHRSDGSGTTYAFTHYLSQIDPNWNSTIGVGMSVNWPTSMLAARGSSGMAGMVMDTPNSIGYVDQYYAQHNNLAVAQIQNSAGNFITPTLATISSAASDFATQLNTDPTFTITNAPGAQSYPISTFTYLIAWKDQTSYDKGYAIANFFWWIVHQGQGPKYGPLLYFPTLPSNIVTIDEGLIKEINYNGQMLVNPST